MTDRSPLTTVAIPSYNRPDRLADCLSALAASDAGSFEVVVVDDGSPRALDAICSAFEGRLAIRCFRQENQGPARARNRAVAEAAGKIIVFTDDDCRPRPDWIRRLTDAIADKPEALAGGVTENALRRDIFAETSQDLVSFLYEYSDGQGGAHEFFTSNNMACHKQTFLEIGGFDESFPLAGGEDREIGLRWRAAGKPLMLVPEARVDHHHQMDLAAFFRQHQNYGRGARQLHLRLDSRGDSRPRFAGAAFYAALLGYPIAKRRPNALIRTLLLFASQAAMVSGYADELFKSRRASDVQQCKPIR